MKSMTTRVKINKMYYFQEDFVGFGGGEGATHKWHGDLRGGNCEFFPPVFCRQPGVSQRLRTIVHGTTAAGGKTG
jgi:hypothetical protein